MPNEIETTLEAPDIGNGLRAASTLLWIVGMLTVLIAFAADLPAIHAHAAGATLLVVDVVSGLIVIGVGLLVRRGRRVGALLLLVAWVGQALSTLPASGHVRAPSPLVTIAVILVAFNWRRLR